LFPGSQLHTLTLTKNKKLRKASIEIQRRHIECLALIALTLQHDTAMNEEARTKVGNIIKRKLLKGNTFKETVQAATSKPSGSSGETETSTDALTPGHCNTRLILTSPLLLAGSNRRIQTANLNLLNSLVSLFSTTALCAATPPYNVLSEITSRLELSCTMVANAKSSNSSSSQRSQIKSNSNYLQVRTSQLLAFTLSSSSRNSNPPRSSLRSSPQLTGSWLFRPEPNISTSSPSTYLRHSVSLSAYHLSLTILKSLLSPTSATNKRLYRDVLISGGKVRLDEERRTAGAKRQQKRRTEYPND